MAIEWRLRSYLATKHGIYQATGLGKVIVKKTGVLITKQNLARLLREKPTSIRFETMEIICSALECRLSDFCEVKPRLYKRDSVKKLAARNIPHSKRGKSEFPDPGDYD